MPVRYLRPGVRDSELIDGLDPLTEVFFYRLLVTVDDYGRFDARPAMLKAQCFPIKDSITAADCEQMLIELVRSGLVFAYDTGACKVIQVQKWDNKPRASASKYKDFTDDCIQLYTDVCDCVQPFTDVALTVTVTETETDNRKPITDARAPRKRAAAFDARDLSASGIDLPACVPADLWKRWAEYRKRKQKPISLDAAKEQIAKLESWHTEGLDLSAIVSNSIANDWTGLFPKQEKPNGGQKRYDEQPRRQARQVYS